MSRKRNDVLNSPYPVSRPERTPESYEDFLDSLQSLFNGGDAEAFFDAIDEAPARWQRKPELMLSKAVGFLRSGDDEGAKKVLAEIERTHPKFAPLYFYKAGLYIQDMCPAHALRMINRVRSVGMLDDEAEQGMNEIGQVARQLISETADELGVSYEKMEKASWFHEAAQEKLSSGQWQVAEQNAREAARLIPNWTSPRNNRSYALYYLGRMNEALTEANAVLAQQPDNLHALKNLAVFHAGLGEDDKARGYSARMALHLQSLPPDSDEVNIIISVLGLVNDDDTLWTLAQKYLKRDDEDLLEGSWHTLGVAAIHSGHLREAQKLLEKIEQYYEPAKSLAVEVRKALKTSGRIPSTSVYSIIGLLLPKTVIEELIEMLGRYLNDERLPQHIQKKMEDYIQKRPFVVNGLLRMMADPEAAEIIPSLLLSFNQPDVDARLLGFALGNLGTSQQRLQVLSKMAQEGREVPPSPIRFWNEEIGEWMDVDFTAQMLSDDVDLNISPKAAIWAEKAQTAQDDEVRTDNTWLTQKGLKSPTVHP